MATRPELLAIRQRLIDEGRSLTLTGEPPHQQIVPQTHFYLLSFGESGEVALLRSGTFFEETIGRSGRIRGRRNSQAIVIVQWDGDTGTSQFMPDKAGLLHEAPEPTLLAVASLEGYDYLDKRLRGQKDADAIRLAAGDA